MDRVATSPDELAEKVQPFSGNRVADARRVIAYMRTLHGALLTEAGLESVRVWRPGDKFASEALRVTDPAALSGLFFADAASVGGKVAAALDRAEPRDIQRGAVPELRRALFVDGVADALERYARYAAPVSGGRDLANVQSALPMLRAYADAVSGECLRRIEGDRAALSPLPPSEGDVAQARKADEEVPAAVAGRVAPWASAREIADAASGRIARLLASMSGGGFSAAAHAARNPSARGPVSAEAGAARVGFFHETMERLLADVGSARDVRGANVRLANFAAYFRGPLEACGFSVDLVWDKEGHRVVDYAIRVENAVALPILEECAIVASGSLERIPASIEPSSAESFLQAVLVGTYDRLVFQQVEPASMDAEAALAESVVTSLLPTRYVDDAGFLKNFPDLLDLFRRGRLEEFDALFMGLAGRDFYPEDLDEVGLAYELRRREGFVSGYESYLFDLLKSLARGYGSGGPLYEQLRLLALDAVAAAKKAVIREDFHLVSSPSQKSPKRELLASLGKAMEFLEALPTAK